MQGKPLDYASVFDAYMRTVWMYVKECERNVDVILKIKYAFLYIFLKNSFKIHTEVK